MSKAIIDVVGRYFVFKEFQLIKFYDTIGIYYYIIGTT